MLASRLQPPSARRRATNAGTTGSDDHPSHKSQIPKWLRYAAAALIGVSLLQAVVGPLLPLVAAHRDVLSQLSAELLKAESLDGSAVRAALSSAGHALAS